MRLIEIFDGSDNLRLCGPFLDANTPEYAILSHTWGTTEAEMTFQEMERMDNRSQKPGWEKIKAFCREARKNGFKYAWVDTVCIDKTSSAELSEAINSMYKWYSKAKVCYAFLEDWSSERRWELKHCRWFTRGWTLQELIAPPNVHFYMNNWQYAGSLETLHKEITNITGIDTFTLGGNPVKRLSVARRMSWASKRVTTREEDEAYCLLGIFGVNLPLLYGEGKRAFIRLQEEILRNLDDQTIFAWNVQSEHNLQASAFWSLLAPSPAFFSHAAEYIPIRGAPQLGEYSVTNSGVLLQAPLVEGSLQYALILQCRVPNTSFLCTVPLVQLRAGSDEYARISHSRQDSYLGQFSLERIKALSIKRSRVFVRNSVHEEDFEHEHAFNYIEIVGLPHHTSGYTLKNVYPPQWYDLTSQMLSAPPFPRRLCGAILRFEHVAYSTTSFLVALVANGGSRDYAGLLEGDCIQGDIVAVFQGSVQQQVYDWFERRNKSRSFYFEDPQSWIESMPSVAPTAFIDGLDVWMVEAGLYIRVLVNRNHPLRVDSLAVAEIYVRDDRSTNIVDAYASEIKRLLSK